MLELGPGSVLGAYVLADRLGRGGMAMVYRAHHAALDREVAIKVLWPSLAETPGFLERFRREARAVSRLRHPNILTVYDFGQQDGITYMVTELLPGGSLSERLGRPLDVRVALRVVRGIGAALDVAHAADLVHRDVKPSNILLTREGEPVLADFGIARMQDGENLTVEGSLIGTPHYMAPEMAAGEDARPASDLYSLGVVLYEMLSGGPPFPRPTPIATVRAHIHETPPPIMSRNPHITYAVDAVVVRAMAKRPSDRYPTGTALANALEQAINAPPFDALEQPTPRPRIGRTTPPPVDPTFAAPLYPPPRDPTPPPHQTGTFAVPVYTASSERVRPTRRRGFPMLPIMLLLAVCLIAAASALVWRSYGGTGRATPTPTRVLEGAQPGSSPAATVASPPPLAAGAPPAGAVASPAASLAAASASPAPSPAPSPALEILPSMTTAPLQPTATMPPPPTPTEDAQRGPLRVAILSPANGSAVDARPPIVGRKTGLQQPDEHLWIMIHPSGGPDNWWPAKQELVPDRDGNWQVNDIEFGGPPGTQHELAVGVADAQTNALILNQLRQNPDDPFPGGRPPGFRELARIMVTKR
jgi:serine/threonine protein kinase